MILLFLFIFIFGLVIGSFLNVVIFRLETKEKIVNDRSKCMNCKHILFWNDLIPVFSFVFLRGRCRYCKAKLSWQYPVVEIVTAFLFVLVLNSQFLIFQELIFSNQFLFSTIYLLIIISSLIVISVFDIRHYIIPDEIIYAIIVVTLIYNFIDDFILSSYTRFHYIFFENSLSSQLYLLLFASGFFNAIFSAFVAFGFFLSIFVFTKGRGMGGGDVKLAFFMGLVLGWPLILLAILLAFVLGSIFGIILIIAQKKNMKSMLPFGPFLVIGTIISLFWGEVIIKWYFNLFIF